MANDYLDGGIGDDQLYGRLGTLCGELWNDYLDQVMFVKKRAANDAVFEMRRAG